MKTLTSICVFTIAVLAPIGAPEVLRSATTEQPTVSLSPTELEWVQHPPSCPGGQAVETLTNAGPGELDISDIAIPVGGGFSQTNTCGSTLGVEESCSITVTWRGGGGSELAQLVVTDNGVGSPQSVPLRGFCISII